MSKKISLFTRTGRVLFHSFFSLHPVSLLQKNIWIVRIWEQLHYPEDQRLFIQSFKEIRDLDQEALERIYILLKNNPENSVVTTMVLQDPKRVNDHITEIITNPNPEAASRRASVVSGCEDWRAEPGDDVMSPIRIAP